MSAEGKPLYVAGRPDKGQTSRAAGSVMGISSIKAVGLGDTAPETWLDLGADYKKHQNRKIPNFFYCSVTLNSSMRLMFLVRSQLVCSNIY